MDVNKVHPIRGGSIPGALRKKDQEEKGDFAVEKTEPPGSRNPESPRNREEDREEMDRKKDDDPSGREGGGLIDIVI